LQDEKEFVFDYSEEEIDDIFSDVAKYKVKTVLNTTPILSLSSIGKIEILKELF
jgi:hypothetical protein